MTKISINKSVTLILKKKIIQLILLSTWHDYINKKNIISKFWKIIFYFENRLMTIKNYKYINYNYNKN